MSTKVSPVWVGYADFLNLLFISFLALFILLWANFAKRDEVVKNNEKEFVQELINTIGKERLNKWQAEITPDGTIRFKNPDYLFDTGKSALKPQFKDIIGEFFPLYMQVLTNSRFRNLIEEVHIDGHTSAIWNDTTAPEEAYFLNLRLSQDRTVNTLEYIVRTQLGSHHDWFVKRAVANGFSSSRPVVNDAKSSRNQRVEFKAIVSQPSFAKESSKPSPSKSGRQVWEVPMPRK